MAHYFENDDTLLSENYKEYTNKAPLFGHNDVIKLRDFIKRYIADEPYEKILIPKNPELLISYKTTPFPVEDAKRIAENLITEAEVLVDEYVMDKHFETNKEVEDVLRNVQRTMIANSLKKELLESETKL